MNKIKGKAKNIILIVVFVILLIHFLKDVTQDILNVNSSLDRLGDIQEDISNFPTWLKWLYYWAMVNTFLWEAVLLALIPKKLWGKSKKNEDNIIIFGIIYIIIMFVIAFFLSL